MKCVLVCWTSRFMHIDNVHRKKVLKKEDHLYYTLSTVTDKDKPDLTFYQFVSTTTLPLPLYTIDNHIVVIELTLSSSPHFPQRIEWSFWRSCSECAARSRPPPPWSPSSPPRGRVDWQSATGASPPRRKERWPSGTPTEPGWGLRYRMYAHCIHHSPGEVSKF